MEYLEYKEIQELQKVGDYKGLTMPLGYSDTARLVLSSTDGVQALPLGGDGDYKAYIIDERTPVPEHYTLHSEHRYWLKVYDDELCMLYIHYCSTIQVYRSGTYGILIQVFK